MIISITSGTICYQCSNLSNCSLIDSQKLNHLGCLIEFEDPDDTGLRVRRINSFCPNNFTECLNLINEKNTWLTFVWNMHNMKTKQLRKNPIVNMWYECFDDQCNNPEYIQNLLTINVNWNIQLFFEIESKKARLNTQCYTCSNQSIPFVCTSLNRCENGCQMQGYRINTNPFANRLLTKYHLNYWQPQCNERFKEYQSINYSINGYLINNLNSNNRNIAIELYCSYDQCNQLHRISTLMNNISITFTNQLWFSTSNGIKQTRQFVFIHCIIIFLIFVKLFLIER